VDLNRWLTLRSAGRSRRTIKLRSVQRRNRVHYQDRLRAKVVTEQRLQRHMQILQRLNLIAHRPVVTNQLQVLAVGLLRTS